MAFADIRQDFLDLVARRRNQSQRISQALLGARSTVAPDFERRFEEKDPVEVKSLFSTEKVGMDVAAALKDGANPGSDADLAASSTQGDALARAKRAFVLRYASPMRLFYHAAGRALGHSEDRGALVAGTQVAQVFVAVSKKNA